MISTKFTFNDCFLQEHLAVNGHNDLFKLLQITIDWVLYLITNCTQNHSQKFCSTLRAQYTQFHIHGWRRLLVWCQQVVEVPDAFPSRSFTEQFFWHITGCIPLHQHTHWHNFVHMVNVGTAFLHSHFGPPKLHNALLQLLFCPRGFPGNTSLQLVPHHFDGVKVRTFWKENNHW